MSDAADWSEGIEHTRRERSAAIRTGLTRLGRPERGFVNPSVVRGSTVTFRTLEEFDRSLKVDLKDGPYTYGLLDTPTERALAGAGVQVHRHHVPVGALEGSVDVEERLHGVLP